MRADPSYRVPGTGDPDGSIPERIVGVDALAEVAREADYLVLTLPLTAASRGLIDAAVLAALPPTAWLINVSRGALVDEDALLEALRAGRLAGAVLDVVGEEPLPPDSPLWDAPNVTITPHVSGATSRVPRRPRRRERPALPRRRAAAQPGRPGARILTRRRRRWTSEIR